MNNLNSPGRDRRFGANCLSMKDFEQAMDKIGNQQERASALIEDLLSVDGTDFIEKSRQIGSVFCGKKLIEVVLPELIKQAKSHGLCARATFGIKLIAGANAVMPRVDNTEDSRTVIEAARELIRDAKGNFQHIKAVEIKAIYPDETIAKSGVPKNDGRHNFGLGHGVAGSIH